MLITELALIPASFVAGIIATIAGGGSFITLPALMLTGLDARTANITSTMALYPMQISTGFSGRKNAAGTQHLSFKELFIISFVGGIVGAFLLLTTSSASFARLVPWLMLFATALFAWGSFRKQPAVIQDMAPKRDRMGYLGAALAQFAIGVYGGYFGGGMGLMMMAVLSYAGMNVRQAITSKNILTAVINTSAVGVFFVLTRMHWLSVGLVAISSSAGGLLGLQIINRVDEKKLRLGIVALGIVMSAILFFHARQ
ncbi:MAG TPA: sulfite exporter TauE/SafE family protein [Alphaproteobacteria bacterium]|nr:sulfite exporter TauE/SafE family protein [Alphaproteobacteria bacterium]